MSGGSGDIPARRFTLPVFFGDYFKIIQTSASNGLHLYQEGMVGLPAESLITIPIKQVNSSSAMVPSDPNDLASRTRNCYISQSGIFASIQTSDCFTSASISDLDCCTSAEVRRFLSGFSLEAFVGSSAGLLEPKSSLASAVPVDSVWLPLLL